MKNRYLAFVSVGFEMIAYIVIAIYLGQYLVEKQGMGDWIKAILIVVAFIVWFISLIVKLKAGEKAAQLAEANSEAAKKATENPTINGK